MSALAPTTSPKRLMPLQMAAAPSTLFPMLSGPSGEPTGSRCLLSTLSTMSGPKAGNPISATGVVWTTVWAFIRLTNRLARVRGSSEICEDTVSVNQTQLRLNGVQTGVGMDHLLLAPGVYICVGSVAGPPGKSHAFALEVTRAGWFAYDDSVVREPLLEYVVPWLAALRFVRRVLIRQGRECCSDSGGLT
ncbi:hypothetical protein JG687_00017763 [Phytophthora cactorum]|uniref:Uncharacterized protein n=1 Tax=Phytophthora cactorum TaxID=29920 RepID=A0A8T1TPJ4_9STRA|nr:hypothetical protein PC120_g22124 [Phytophthora cactorum]KAG4041824.1 hypothetical protein PC123_g22671 [Phytophthora cactorum]KAG6944617.1 hypothetical protein JG687_00017763 [Phytophthora cactorum]